MISYAPQALPWTGRTNLYAGDFASQLFPIGTQTLTNRSTYPESLAHNGFIAKFLQDG